MSSVPVCRGMAGMRGSESTHARGRLLIVEDDRDLRDGLTALLQQSGYEVEGYADGSLALAAFMDRSSDLAIVDLMLPGLSGLDLILRMRRRASEVPILVISAREAVAERVSVLDAGADDYLVKPFPMVELEARVRALLRRSHARKLEELAVGPSKLILDAGRISIDGASVDLPSGELLLLEALAEKFGHVVSKETIAGRLSRRSEPVTDTAIEVRVHRLRRRLAPLGFRIRTLRGFGYLLERNAGSDASPQ